MASTPFSAPFRVLHPTPPSPSCKPRLRNALLRPRSALSDPFVLQLAETFEDSLSTSSSAPSPPPLLQKLRDSSSASVLSKSWPSRRDEPFRFTDVSFLKQSDIVPVSVSPAHRKPHRIPDFSDAELPSLVVVDGRVEPGLSNLTGVPSDIFVGSICVAPDSIARIVADCIAEFPDGDLFWDLNGIGAPDVAVVYVPAGARMVEQPLHVVFYSEEGGEDGSNKLPVSNPRCVVVVEKGGEIGIVEEYLDGENGGKCYWANSVMEILVEEGAKLRHSYVQRQAANAAHIKWTFVRQGLASMYELVEISTGGKLSRHNLHIQQLGPDTQTELCAFHLCGHNQTQDLHSKLILDYPRGKSQQLHKCIVTHSSGKAVFDGNIKVNRLAQQTDAGQLSRTLLLAPKSTVNLKPNLQIIADDVKCSHGAAISDLEEDQLFYLQTRGVDLQAARKALVFSFAAEVTQRLPCSSLRKRVENDIQVVLPAIRES